MNQWHLEDFYLCIFSSGVLILFEYIFLTSSLAKKTIGLVVNA